jgi:hypothetical protein
MNRYRFALTALVASLSLAALTLVGCKADDAKPPTYSCATKGPCPSDPVPSDDEVTACEALTSDVDCGEAFSAYSACAFSAAICMDGGLSDPSADATSKACASEYAAYTTCLGNKINDAGATP